MFSRYKLLDAFRGLAIVWIVFFHLLAGYREQYPETISFIIKHGSLGVASFFVISGYGMALSLEKNLSVDGESAYYSIVKRFRKIYLPYWFHLVFVAILIPLSQAAVSMLKTHSFSLDFFNCNYSFWEWFQIVTLTKIFSASSGALNKAFLPLNGVVWFIAVLVQIYFVSYLSLLFKGGYLFFLFLVFVLSLLTDVMPGMNILVPHGLFLPYFKQFYVGIILYYFLKNNLLLQLRTKYSFFVTMVFYSLFSIIAVYFIFSPFLFALLIGFLFWILFPYDEKLSNLIFVRFLSVFGIFSYSLYLLHVPLSPLVGMFVRNLVPLDPKITTPFILVPSVIVISAIWYLFFEKPKSLLEVLVRVRHPLKTLSAYRVFCLQQAYDK